MYMVQCEPFLNKSICYNVHMNYFLYLKDDYISNDAKCQPVIPVCSGMLYLLACTEAADFLPLPSDELRSSTLSLI